MTDEELIRDFIRREATGDLIGLSVGMIVWEGAHTPKTHWELIATIPADAHEERLQVQLAATLRDRRYFDVCRECNERQPVGWMVERGLCQGCAARNHGVVF